MGIALREGVSFCAAGGRHFFLDRSKNRYFALSNDDEIMFAAILDAESGAGSPIPLSISLASLLVDQPEGTVAPVLYATHPAVGIEDAWGAQENPLLLVRAFWSFSTVKLTLTRMPVARLLDDLAAGKPDLNDDAVDPDLLMQLATAFETLRSFAGQDQCLPLSLAFARCAYRLKQPVSIVFGITPRPFGAHCWIQSGNRILNDTLGRVEHFTPIYAQ